MKRTKKKLKAIQAELISLIEFMSSEAYFRGQDMHYRLKIPYPTVNANDEKIAETQMVIDISVYFDGEMSDAGNDDKKVRKFKITGPDKDRH